MSAWRMRLAILTGSHFINDMFNGLLIAVLPILSVIYHLSYTQVAVLILVNGVSAGLLQPVLARVMESVQGPWVLLISPLLLAGGCFSFSVTGNFAWLVMTMAIASFGSTLFHPEANRSVYQLRETNRGVIQSTFQIGGNLGMACASIGLWYLNHFSLRSSWLFLCIGVLVSLCAIPLLGSGAGRGGGRKKTAVVANNSAPKSSVRPVWLLVAVVTCRALVNSGVVSFLPLYLLASQRIVQANVWEISLLFLSGGALGTWAGGLLHGKIEERRLIQTSFLISTPIAYIALVTQGIGLSICLILLGFTLMCTFSVTVLYAQKLMPGRAALAASMVVGLTSGISGVIALVLGIFADTIGIADILYVFFSLPLVGLVLSLWLKRVAPPALNQPQHSAS